MLGGDFLALFDKKCNCIGVAIIASLVLGIIAAFLQITAVITVTPAFLWVLFGVAVGYLAILLIAAFTGNKSLACAGTVYSLSATLIGILGTIFASVILLAIAFAATSIIGAIIVGALIFFFTLTLTVSACLVKYLAYFVDR